MPSNLASLLVTLIPIAPTYHFKGPGKTTALEEQQIHNREDLRKVFELISRHPQVPFNTGKHMLGAGSHTRQCYPVICAWIGDNFEHIHLHSIKQPHPAVCQAPKLSVRDGNSLSLQLRDNRVFFQKMIHVTHGDETEIQEVRKYLDDHKVQTSERILYNMKCISRMTIIVPGILHTIYSGRLQHWMHWVMFFLEQHSMIDKFNWLWALMPPDPGFTRFIKPSCQVTQWSGTETKALGRVIVPVFAVTLSKHSVSHRIPSTDALLCIKNIEYFHLMAQYRYHTEATIQYMDNHLEEIHCPDDVFS